MVRSVGMTASTRMKAAVLYADRVTTVSPSYAGEIQTPEFGKGLDQIMRMESGKLSGIVNGIDTDLLDPETDAHIPYHFSVDDLSGKAKDKAALQTCWSTQFVKMFH